MAGSALSRVANRIVARRLQHRLGAAVAATAFVAASLPAVSFAAPTQEEIGRLYGEGQEHMEQKEFGRAADVFTRLLNLLDESAENKAIRESLILNILDARMQAYDGQVNQDGQQLYDGRDTLQTYYKDFQAVHGDSVAVIAEIQSMAAKLDEKIAQHEKSKKPAATGTPDETTPDETVGPKQDGGDRQVIVMDSKPGNPLIFGGVGLGLLGVGALVMIPVGSSLGKSAETDYNNAQAELAAATSDSERASAQSKIDEANADGERANAVLISGAVLAPLLIGGSVALIVLGVRKNNNAKSPIAKRPIETLTASPSFGRNFSGFSLQGRF